MTLHALTRARAVRPLEREPDGLCGHVAFIMRAFRRQLLGMLAQALGRSAQAAVHYQAALAQSDSADWPAR